MSLPYSDDWEALLGDTVTEFAGSRSAGDPLITSLEVLPDFSAPKYFGWEFDRLVGHILSVHHLYIRAVLPRLRDCFVGIDASDLPVFEQCRERFLPIVGEWTHQLDFKEFVLFPFILQLERSKRNEAAVPVLVSKSFSDEIEWIVTTNEKFRKLMSATSLEVSAIEFPLQANAPATEIKDLLNRFRKEFSILLFLEECILFPAPYGSNAKSESWREW